MKRNKLSILSAFLIILISMVNITCFERNDMYDFAKNGLKVIYAMNVSSNTVFRVTEDGGYNESYSVTTSYSSSGKGFFPLNEKLIAVEDDAYDIYFHTYDGESWYAVGPHTLSNNLTGIFLIDDSIIYSEVYNIYKYDGISWQTLSNITTPASILAATQYKGDIYIFGSDYFVYRYTYSPTAVIVNTAAITMGSSFNFFDVVDGIVYIGYDNKLNYAGLGSASAYTVISPANIKSYAIYNSSAVYAAGYTTQIEIMKLNSGSFTTIKQIAAATAPDVVIKALSETKLVLGISGSTSNDGLYILDTKSGDLKTLATEPISTINILNY